MYAMQPDFSELKIYNDLLTIRTEERMQFIDLTGWVSDWVRRSGIGHGQLQVQALHTTAAIVVNENEPLLLEDFKAFLERIAPEDAAYSHDDPHRRSVNLVPGERANGHAHARALLLGSSHTFSVLGGRNVVRRLRVESLYLVVGERLEPVVAAMGPWTFDPTPIRTVSMG